MRWNITTSAYGVIDRPVPNEVREVESILTRILSESDMDETTTPDRIGKRLIEVFGDRLDMSRFLLGVDINSWGFLPRPKNLYTWVALGGFLPPIDLPDEGEFDTGFLVFTFNGIKESLKINTKGLTTNELKKLEQAQKDVAEAEFEKAAEVPLPTVTLPAEAMFDLPLPKDATQVLRAPNEVVRILSRNPTKIIATIAPNLNFGKSLVDLFLGIIQKQDANLTVLVIQMAQALNAKDAENTESWVICLTKELNERLGTWFEDSPSQEKH